jgi:hypothetical protein
MILQICKVSWYFIQTGEAQGCGGVLNSTTGRITTGDGEYEPNLDCRWRIIVGDNKIVKLTIEGMEIESHSTCYYDFVQVCFCYCFFVCLF